MPKISLKIKGYELKKKLKITDGLPGRTPIKGVDYFDGVGIDGKDARPEDVLLLVEERLPQLGEKVRDSLELLEGDERLKIEAIKDLREELEELRKLAKKVSFGGASISASHSPRHETFTGGPATLSAICRGQRRSFPRFHCRTIDSFQTH